MTILVEEGCIQWTIRSILSSLCQSFERSDLLRRSVRLRENHPQSVIALLLVTGRENYLDHAVFISMKIPYRCMVVSVIFLSLFIFN